MRRALFLSFVCVSTSGMVPGAGRAQEITVELEPSEVFLYAQGDSFVDIVQYLFSDGPPHVQGTDCRMMPGCPAFCTR